MFRSSNNIAARIFHRQIATPLPGTSVHCARQFYENLVPSFTIYEVDCPDICFRKFTDDGLYLVSFSRNQQDLIVYRPTWPSFSCKEENCHSHDLPPKVKKFESFFTHLYSLQLASSNELICKDFFLYMESNRFGLFATSTAQNHDAPAAEGAISGIPSIGKITFYLVRLEDGVIMDERVFHNDFVNLGHSNGVFLYDDLLAIVSIRYQTIYILQIRDCGTLVDVRAIGSFCREDDELFLSSYAQGLVAFDKGKKEEASNIQNENGLQHLQPTQGGPFLSGIKQRLLSFIFRGIWNEETDHTLRQMALVPQLCELSTVWKLLDGLVEKWDTNEFFLCIQQMQYSSKRVQYLKKKFYFHFQDYVDLIMWKVQFLDRHHLLIKFGSVDGGVSRNAEHHPAFFAVYNMETTEIIAFYQQNSAEELYYLFEKYADHFRANSRSSMHTNFVSSHSNNVYAFDQLNNMKGKASGSSQFVKRMLSSLPFSCQSQSPSAYFDHSLFRYDEKLISATDRPRQSTEHPIKFILRRPPCSLRFKIKTGPEAGTGDGRSKRICSFLFHPILPLIISVQQTYMQPTVVNIHFRR